MLDSQKQMTQVIRYFQLYQLMCIQLLLFEDKIGETNQRRI